MATQLSFCLWRFSRRSALAARSAATSTIENLNSTIMSKATAHIPFTTLVDLAESRTTIDEPMRLHLAVCQRCAGDLAWLTRTIDLMRTDQASNPPAAAVARVKRLIQARPRPRATSLRQRLVAHMNFDSAQAPLAFGIRAGAGGQRQLLFEADQHMIDMRLTPNGELWSISGQVLGNVDFGRVNLGNADTSATAELNQLSEFVLPPVPAGRYTLTLALDDRDIDIPDLEIK